MKKLANRLLDLMPELDHHHFLTEMGYHHRRHLMELELERVPARVAVGVAKALPRRRLFQGRE